VNRIKLLSEQVANQIAAAKWSSARQRREGVGRKTPSTRCKKNHRPKSAQAEEV